MNTTSAAIEDGCSAYLWWPIVLGFIVGVILGAEAVNIRDKSQEKKKAAAVLTAHRYRYY